MLVQAATSDKDFPFLYYMYSLYSSGYSDSERIIGEKKRKQSNRKPSNLSLVLLMNFVVSHRITALNIAM